VCDFSLAINERFTSKDGDKKEVTEYIDFTAWSKNAETIAQYVDKGQSMYVEAKAKTDKWADKTTGENRSKVKFEVLGYQFLGSKAGPSQASVSQTTDVDEIEEDLEDSDIPF